MELTLTFAILLCSINEFAEPPPTDGLSTEFDVKTSLCFLGCADWFISPPPAAICVELTDTFLTTFKR